MRTTPKIRIEEYRKSHPSLGWSKPGENWGYFKIPYRNFILTVVSSDGEGWEHVSVSLPNRCPNWEEMSFIKDLFWSEDETVIQYHPRKQDYVNTCKTCLHLWRKIGTDDSELPPKRLIG